MKTHNCGMMVKIFGLMTLFIIIICQDAVGATYYISPSGSDTNSCTTAQSTSTPKKTFSSAWGCLSAGDTLSVADGTYTSASPPSAKSGTSANPITILAANDGEAKITGGLNIVGSSYLTFIGLKVTGTTNAIYQYSNGTGAPSHHNTFQRIGFNCTDVTLNDDACFDMSDGTHHTLVEDSWGWGGGRYTMMLYGGSGGSPPNTKADWNTIRRVVLRMGPSTSTSGNPQAGFMAYTASNNLIENVLVIDSMANSDTSNSAFYIGDHPGAPNADNNAFYGVIALNNYGAGWYIDSDGIANNNKVFNSVFWGSKESGLTCYTASSPSMDTGTTISHVTSGGNFSGHGYDNYRCSSVSVKNSIFVNNVGYGIYNSGGGSVVENYNDFYGNVSGARSGVSAGANSIASNPVLLYILRTENGSLVKGSGEGGTDIGANVTKRYQDGVLTNVDLWPWPNEARIKKEMCTDAGITRGFCSTGNNPLTGNPITLTNYVWEYIGNPYPNQTTKTPKPPMIMGVTP